MSSVIFAVMGCVAGLALAALSLRRVSLARGDWEMRPSSTPAVARWLWMATVACCAFTSAMMVLMSLATIATRGAEAGMEGSLASRVAVYVGGFGYVIAWLRGRVAVRWPSLVRRGPKLLPPAPFETLSPGDTEKHDAAPRNPLEP